MEQHRQKFRPKHHVSPGQGNTRRHHRPTTDRLSQHVRRPFGRFGPERIEPRPRISRAISSTAIRTSLLYGSDCNDVIGRGPGCQGAQTIATARNGPQQSHRTQTTLRKRGSNCSASEKSLPFHPSAKSNAWTPSPPRKREEICLYSLSPFLNDSSLQNQLAAGKVSVQRINDLSGRDIKPFSAF